MIALLPFITGEYTLVLKSGAVIIKFKTLYTIIFAKISYPIINFFAKWRTRPKILIISNCLT